MKKSGEITLGILLCVAALIFFAYVALFQLGDQEAFLIRQIEDNRLEEVVGLDQSTIVRAYKQIFDFSEGKRDSLTEPMDSFAYSQKEIHHMEDVRSLFLLLRRLALVSMGIIGLVGYFILTKRMSGVTIWVSSFATALAIGIGAILAMNQFQAAFVRFHELLFSNELWLLDPRTDFLIQIMPQAFFVETAKWLFARILIGYGLLHALLGAVYKYK